MMSGDSPTSHKDYIDFKDSHLTPTPTTSKDFSPPSYTANADTAVAATICVGKSPKEEAAELLDSAHEKGDDCKPQTDDSLPNPDNVPDSTDSAPKVNGALDKFDDQWKTSTGASEKKEEEQEDGCGVKCLYYTLQCCECMIM